MSPSRYPNRLGFSCYSGKSPDSDDLKKLGRVLKYLCGTQLITLVLQSDDLTVMKWWIDGSYAIHPDMRSHTGATLLLGKGFIYSSSILQKLNTKSSTGAELVAVVDVLPQVLWTRYFLAAQGYDVNAATIYQANQSAILLKKTVKPPAVVAPMTSIFVTSSWPTASALMKSKLNTAPRAI